MHKPSRAIVQYTSLAWFAAHLPRRAELALASIAGAFGPIVARQKRVIVAAHLSKVLGIRPTNAQIRESFASYVRYWFEAFRTPSLSKATYLERMDTQGFEYIEQPITQGRGVILALPHLGNWDVAGAWLVAKGIRVTVVAEALEPEMFEWFEKFRASLGLRVVVNGPKVSAQLLEALHRNEAIALLCDRDVDGTGKDFVFFGEQTKIPRGPATLAIRSGADLVPVAVYENGDRFLTRALPPISTERQGKLGDDVDRVTQELLHEFEGLIRSAPTQWHVFQPNWPSVVALVRS